MACFLLLGRLPPSIRYRDHVDGVAHVVTTASEQACLTQFRRIEQGIYRFNPATSPRSRRPRHAADRAYPDRDPSQTYTHRYTSINWPFARKFYRRPPRAVPRLRRIPHQPEAPRRYEPRRDQNEYFKLNCRIRLPPALVTRPKVVVPTVLPGAPNNGVFVILNASARN